MKKCLSLYILLACCLLSPIQAKLAFETNLIGGWSKRFIDDFDRGWPNLKYNTDEIGSTSSVTNLSFLRNFGYARFDLLLSPFYKHLFGISGTFIASMGSSNKTSTIGPRKHTSALTTRFISPAITYKFYPMKKKSTSTASFFYIGGDLGVALANANLSHTQAHSSDSIQNYSEIVDFNNIIGLRIALNTGISFPAFGNFRWVIQAGFDIMRIHDVKGVSSRGQTLGFKENSSRELVLLSPTNFTTDFVSISIWYNQAYVSFGLSFMLE